MVVVVLDVVNIVVVVDVNILVAATTVITKGTVLLPSNTWKPKMSKIQ